MSIATPTPRILTPTEIGGIVRLYRDEFAWSQETLAELSGLTSRTIQRLEAGRPSSLDTRRAVAQAFRFEDMDWFSKPIAVPTGDELTAQRQAFDRDHLVLDAKLVDGRGLLALMIDHGCDSLAGTALSELPLGVREAFAAALDFVYDTGEVLNVVGRAKILACGDELDEILKPMMDTGFTLSAAYRKTSITGKGWKNSIPITAIYLAVAPTDAPPNKIAVSRKVRFGI